MNSPLVSLAALLLSGVVAVANAQEAASAPDLEALLAEARAEAARPAPSPAQQIPSAPAAPAVTAESGGVVSEVVRAAPAPAQPAPRPRRPAAAPAPEKPFHDLPINGPAREALTRSAEWANREDVIVAGGRNGRVTFVYGESMPTVVCAPLRVCEIELQPGERVNGAPLIGDEVRWSVTPGLTGSGDSRVVHVLIRPERAGLDTNLVIPTDRRMYRLRLVSDEENYLSVLGFTYPADDRRAWDAVIASETHRESSIAAELPPMSATSLDFNYEVRASGRRPAWMPIRAFADGSKTYIQLPPDVGSRDVPALIVVGPGGDEQLVNFRLAGCYFVVDRVIDHAMLLSGVGRQAQRVEVKRCEPRAFRRCGS